MLNKRFAVINHEYYNTGGNCMVSIFTVFDKQNNATRYVLMNDEGFQLATVDVICNDEMFETDEERDAAVLGYWSVDDLTTEPSYDQHQFTDEEWELYKHCQFEFYVKDCKYFNRDVKLPVNQFPQEMLDNLHKDIVAWHIENECDLSTDGLDVYVSQQYADYRKQVLDKELQQIKDFSEWHENQAAKSELYGEHYTISFNGRSVKLPYDADVFNAIDNLLKNTIEEW